MADHPNATLYRDVFESGNYADRLADDVEWWEIGSPEPVRGREAFIRHREASAGKWDLTTHLHDVVANDTHVIGLIEATVVRDGESLDYWEAEVLHIEDGEFTHRWALADDTEAIARMFAD